MYRKPAIPVNPDYREGTIIKNETTQGRILRLTGFDVYKCPFCKEGQMHAIEIIPKIRSPVKFLYLKN